MKAANLSKTLVAGVAVAVLLGVVDVASAQYPSVSGSYYSGSSYGTYYPGSYQSPYPSPYPGTIDPGYS